MTVPPAGLALVATAGAVVAATADAAPTGLAAADVVAKAALGAATVVAAAVAGPVVCAVAGGLAVVCSGGSSEAAVAAGGALGLVIAVLAAGERAPALLAVAGGALAAAALRFEWPEPTGTSALAATVVVAPVLVVALGRAPRRVRRAAGRGAVAAVGFLAVASGLAAVAALGARDSVDEGVKAARSGLAAVEDADRDAAATHFARAAAAFRRADRSIGAWWARPALVVPIVGQHERALRTLAASGAELATVGARTAREADPSTLRLMGGGIDLDALAAVRRPVEAALASLERSERDLEDARSPWLVAPVADRVEELAERVQSASGSTRTAVLALRHAPTLLGADGPRRYFIAVQNPAEARGAGGLIGNWGELLAEDGRLTLGRFGRSQELNEGGAGPDKTLSGPADYVRRYEPYKPHVFWQSITMSPDFPTVARVIRELYPQSGGTEVDGVISVDPFAFAAFLKLVGPVEVPGREEPLTADNAAEVLLHRQYLEYPETERADFLGLATFELFARLTSSSLPAPRAVGEALGPMVAGRHLQLASTRPAEQRFFEHIGAAGAVPPVKADSLGVVTQNFGGNKIDWFLRRSYSYDVRYDPESGAVRSTLEVRLRNDAPAAGLPRSVIGYGGAVPDFTRFGENLLLLSVYTPFAVESILVDGQPVEAREDRELGRRVYSALVSIPPRSSRTVRVELAGRVAAGGLYRLDVLRQPTVVPDEVSVSVDAGDRWRVRSARRLVTAGPGRAAGSGPVDRNLVFAVELDKPATDFLGRLRRGR